MLLHDYKVEVWCVIRVWRIILMYWMILSLSFNELIKEKNVWAFMQDNAGVHTANSSLDA
jgi:hypothetical protein